jgi:ribonucleoside-diphosphate reductase alpha chain
VRRDVRQLPSGIALLGENLISKGRDLDFKFVDVAELGQRIEAPAGWSYNAIRIFGDKYLSQRDNNSIPAAIRRVALGVSAGNHALCEYLYEGMLAQRFAFNSPVFFNVGVEPQPQCSACFIQSVEDNMDSILELAVKEGQLFKHGSGTGTNLSAIRSSKEKLSGGGIASGPVSFMRAYDAVAGIVKSGGKTRRAAKMQILDVDHPDIMEFIGCKVSEEQKARDLIQKAGYENSFDGEAYSSIFFQNANLSVRVTDEFMHAVGKGAEHTLTARTTGEIIDTLQARTILDAMAQAAWHCGDPGIQFADTINEWHTCPQYGDIQASNPCSEYMFLDETSCNLASLNLAKYLLDDGEFDVSQFQQDICMLVDAMDNIVELAGYPTKEIAQRSRKFRTLGIGYTNLGMLLISKGLRYDSPEARDYAASLTALMHFTAYSQSAVLAEERGAYGGYSADEHLRVLNMHINKLPQTAHGPIWKAAGQAALTARHLAETHGLRNAQLTVLAPTGTISFIMDAVTTGIEPPYARTITKQLAGGGTITIDLGQLGSAVRTADEISPYDHVLMMSACQPFLSGAISKTINMPNTATPKDIADIYEFGWASGVKSLAVYRDGSKAVQPMTTATESLMPIVGTRQPLPSVRSAITHKFSVAGHEGYITVGLYPDGRPGEVFVQIAKEGSTISGLLDSWAITLSIALQHGVPLEAIVDKLAYMRFEPAGMTGNSDIPMAHSLIDYLCRWLILHFDTPVEVAASRDEKTCSECGGMLVRTGTCYSCPTCGANGGCG